MLSFTNISMIFCISLGSVFSDSCVFDVFNFMYTCFTRWSLVRPFGFSLAVSIIVSLIYSWSCEALCIIACANEVCWIESPRYCFIWSV